MFAKPLNNSQRAAIFGFATLVADEISLDRWEIHNGETITEIERFQKRHCRLQSKSSYNHRMEEVASYVCDSCGEEISLSIDQSAGESQQFVEDCPVCCNPMVIRVEIDNDGGVRAWAERE